MGIPDKKPQMKSVNQEKFRQIREKMDTAGSKFYRN